MAAPLETTRMRKLVLTLASALALASSGIAAGPAPDGHARMVALLAEMSERQPIRAAYSQQVEQLKSRLFQLRRSISDVQRLGIRHGLGRALLAHGDYYEALENFEQMKRETRVLTASQSLPVALSANFWSGAAELQLAVDGNCDDPGAGACRYPFGDRWESDLDDWPRRASTSFDAVLHLARSGSELALAASWLSRLSHEVTGSELAELPARVTLPDDPFRSAVPGVQRLADAADALDLAHASLSGGVVADDLDGDGWIDLMISSADLDSQVRTYRNESGRFVDVTEESGLQGITGGHNLVQADYDGDGDLDVLVLRGGWLGSGGSLPNSLLRNEGGFAFVDVTFDVGLAEVVFPSPVGAWADFDLDGDLDLFLGNDASERAGFASQLFRNDDGRFVDVSDESRTAITGRVQGAVWGDVDDDGWPDLFVAVFGGPDRLLRNRRDGRFEDITEKAGIAPSDSSATAWFWDADGDGRLDLLVSSSRMSRDTGPDVWYWYADLAGLPHPAEPTRLYLGDGDGGFREVAAEWGLDRVTLAHGGNFGDIDNDGRLDFHLTTGYSGYESLVPDLLYRNRGDGFDDITHAAGVGELRRGAAVAFADIDNDGDQDLFVKRGGLLPDDRVADSLYQNPVGGSWLEVELRGRTANRFGVGARVRLRYSDREGHERELTRWIGSGGSFGAGPLRAHFGLREAIEIREVAVRWPGEGREQRFRDVPMSARVLITQDAESLRTLYR